MWLLISSCGSTFHSKTCYQNVYYFNFEGKKTNYKKTQTPDTLPINERSVDKILMISSIFQGVHNLRPLDQNRILKNLLLTCILSPNDAKIILMWGK